MRTADELAKILEMWGNGHPPLIDDEARLDLLLEAAECLLIQADEIEASKKRNAA